MYSLTAAKGATEGGLPPVYCAEADRAGHVAGGKTVYSLTAAKGATEVPTRLTLRVSSQTPGALSSRPQLSSNWLRGAVHRDCSSDTGLKHTITWEQAAIRQAWSGPSPPSFQVQPIFSCSPLLCRSDTGLQPFPPSFQVQPIFSCSPLLCRSNTGLQHTIHLGAGRHLAGLVVDLPSQLPGTAY